MGDADGVGVADGDGDGVDMVIVIASGPIITPPFFIMTLLTNGMSPGTESFIMATIALFMGHMVEPSACFTHFDMASGSDTSIACIIAIAMAFGIDAMTHPPAMSGFGVHVTVIIGIDTLDDDDHDDQWAPKSLVVRVRAVTLPVEFHMAVPVHAPAGPSIVTVDEPLESSTWKPVRSAPPVDDDGDTVHDTVDAAPSNVSAIDGVPGALTTPPSVTDAP